ncbi:hypothetical protein [Devosia oryzisoli]|uniref:hypothetical protein n=1 Tax=Devosia oryzisoli TaxID=2774138 RepID=UPI003D134204
MINHFALLAAKGFVAKNLAQGIERAEALGSMGRKQIKGLKRFHGTLESRGRRGGNQEPRSLHRPGRSL